MKIEVRIAPIDEGRDIISQTIIGNRGRLRWVGVRYINDLFPKWQALHDRIMGYQGAPTPEMAQDAAKLNEDILLQCAELGVTTAMLLIDLPERAELLSLSEDPDFHQRLACLMKGFENQAPVLHLTASDPLSVTGLVQHEKQVLQSDTEAFAEELASQRLQHDWQRQVNAQCAKVLEQAKIVVRDGARALSDTKDVVHTFFRDIGVVPETMKLNFGAALPDEDAHAVAQRISAYLTANPEDMPSRVIQPVARVPRAQLPLTIFFMVEPGPLETQAHLLIASLLVHCRDLFQMVGFCRKDRITGLHPETVKFLSENGVMLRGIENRFEDGYPAGNKLHAAAEVGAEGWAVFLDTDMCLVRDSSFMDVAIPDRVSLCLDNVIGWARTDAEFEAVAAVLGFEKFPPKLALWSGLVSHPTYNAGLVLFPPAEAGPSFGERWYASALKLENDPRIANKRPWLDTIALAGLAAKEGNVRQLPLEWNCTTRSAEQSTRILHYHGLRQLHQFGWVQRADEILAASPSPFNTLGELVQNHKRELGIQGDLMRRAMRHGMFS